MSSPASSTLTPISKALRWLPLFPPAFFLLALPWVAVLAALCLQFAWGLEPCTMCILQRYAFLALAAFAIFCAVARGVVSRLMVSMVAVATSIAGLGISLFIQKKIMTPGEACGRDRLAAFLNDLPWVDVFPQLFEATGMCGDPVPPVLGVQIHAWSFLLFTLLALFWGLRTRRLIKAL